MKNKVASVQKKRSPALNKQKVKASMQKSKISQEGLKRKKNPLFVVTKKGTVVQEASGKIDAFIKRCGIDKAVQLFDNYLKVIMQYLKGYPQLKAVEKLLNAWIEILSSAQANVETLLAMATHKIVGPFKNFYKQQFES